MLISSPRERSTLRFQQVPDTAATFVGIDAVPARVPGKLIRGSKFQMVGQFQARTCKAVEFLRRRRDFSPGYATQRRRRFKVFTGVENYVTARRKQ